MSVVNPIIASKGYSKSANLEAENAAPHLEGWMKDTGSARTEMVSANQLTSLSAMISFLASQSGQSEFRIERSLSNRFSIPNTKCLPANQYDSAIRYLVDTLAG